MPLVSCVSICRPAVKSAAYSDTTVAGSPDNGRVSIAVTKIAAGWLLAVATGKSDRGLVSCLEGHGIRQRFVSLQTADRHPSKPHPAMLQAALDEAGAMAEDSVLIGDTSFDIEMAVACGVRAIGVAWGYHEAQELLRAGAEAVAETPAELAELLA